MKLIKTVILYSQVISLLEDPLSRHSQVVILSSIDTTVHLWLVIILAIWKLSVNHWKLPCCYKYFDCGIWLKAVQIPKCLDNQGLDNQGPDNQEPDNQGTTVLHFSYNTITIRSVTTSYSYNYKVHYNVWETIWLYMNYDIIAVVMVVILSIMGNCSKA